LGREVQALDNERYEIGSKMKNNKLNGTAKWIIIIIAIGTIAYNTIATHVISKNDIKHLQEDVTEIKKLLIDHITMHK